VLVTRVVGAVMAVAVIVATAVAAATVVAARPMATRPVATAMPGRRRDMTRVAVRATTHGVLTEMAIARVTVTVGRAQ